MTTSSPALASPNADSAQIRSRHVPPTNGVDDSLSIQKVLDEGPGEVIFGARQTWIIDATAGSGGLSPHSDTRIVLEDGAELKVRPNSDTASRLIDIGRDGPVRNVTVEGAGFLTGDASEHLGSAGEWGHLIHITNGSNNIQISGQLTLRNAWGDAIYIGDGSAVNRDVLIDSVLVEDCRREGIAPFWVSECVVRNCTIRNIGSSSFTAPASGIDCEPNTGQYVSGLTLERNTIEGTAGCGIYISSNPGPITDVILRENKVKYCGCADATIATYQTNGVHIAGVGSATLVENTIEGSGYDNNPNGPSGQIYVRSSESVKIVGGRVAGGRGRGVLVTGSKGVSIMNASIESNDREALVIYKSDVTSIAKNIIRDNAEGENADGHILIQRSNNTTLVNNLFSGGGGSSWLSIEGRSAGSVIGGNRGIGESPRRLLTDEGVGTVLQSGGLTIVK